MTDQPAIRQQLIEQAARIAGLIDWNPTCLPGQHETTIVRQVLESAASLGLLADPEQHAESFLARLGRQQVDEVVVALGPIYNTERHSWSAGTLARKAAADLARGGTRTDIDPATIGALARIVLALGELPAEHLRAKADLTADRDRLSLLLRAMARKLVAYRRWADGDVPTVHKLRAERDALLPRLAELAEHAGKLRSAEWLRTCATLPMEQWPPAPAYKGPMVPAAELAEAQRERDTWESEYERVRDLKMTDLAAALAERDALQARIDAAVAELDASCPPPRLSRIRAALQGDQAAEEAGRD